MQSVLIMTVKYLIKIMVPIRVSIEIRHVVKNLSASNHVIAVCFEVLGNRCQIWDYFMPFNAVVVDAGTAGTFASKGSDT